MLTIILDTSAIDMTNSQIQRELAMDLRRMDHLKHDDMPEESDAYSVKVMPSSRTYSEALHRFVFEIQYGNMVEGKFEPKGEKVLCQTETLPMI